jgi:hypothetical protein
LRVNPLLSASEISDLMRFSTRIFDHGLVHGLADKFTHASHVEQPNAGFVAAYTEQNAPDFSVGQQVVERASFEAEDFLHVASATEFWGDIVEVAGPHGAGGFLPIVVAHGFVIVCRAQTTLPDSEPIPRTHGKVINSVSSVISEQVREWSGKNEVLR